MIPSEFDIRCWIDDDGSAPFEEWFEDLDPRAAAKVTVAPKRLGTGNTSNVESIGGGLSELKIDFGPGCRVYFGREGQRLVILLAGGTKKRQQRDIDTAKARWRYHLASKR
ncbi:MAG: type II toxin-antitoxin system RelE/ParE family toxin [Siculibacillus sp.]|nr:type II toxin-antitoxin system RelE/ParE family toxin [Siculibacillus sp.]